MVKRSLIVFKILTAALIVFPFFVKAVSVGEPAPEFSLPLLDEPGTLVSLNSSSGKVRYVDFWASWCAPCRISLPAIINLQNELSSEQFEVIAVNVDENPRDAQRFLRRYALKHNVLSDPQGEVAAKYELPGMPTSFLVDGNGRVVYRHLGFKENDIEIIKKQVLGLLEAIANAN